MTFAISALLGGSGPSFAMLRALDPGPSDSASPSRIADLQDADQRPAPLQDLAAKTRRMRPSDLMQLPDDLLLIIVQPLEEQEYRRLADCNLQLRRRLLAPNFLVALRKSKNDHLAHARMLTYEQLLELKTYVLSNTLAVQVNTHRQLFSLLQFMGTPEAQGFNRLRIAMHGLPLRARASIRSFADGLSHATQLQELDLSELSLSPALASALTQSLKKLNKIESLKLNSSFLRWESTIEAFAQGLPEVRGLRRLSLKANCFTTDHLAPLLAVLPATRIQALDLSNNPALFRDASEKLAALLLLPPPLKRLNLTHTGITAAGLRTLALSAGRTQIEELRISYAVPQSQAFPPPEAANSDEALALRSFFQLLSALPVTHLDLSHSFLNRQMLEDLSQALLRGKITSLKLAATHPVEGALENLFQSLIRSSLTSLDLTLLHGTTQRTWEQLARVLPSTPLTSLALAHHHLTPQALGELGRALPQSKITSLDCSYCSLGNAGLQILAPFLAQSTHLSKLNLRANGLGALGFGTLARLLPASRITELNLSQNFPAPSGIKFLAQALIHAPVQVLDLSLSGLTTKAAAQLAPALSHSSLLELSLGGNALKDQGLRLIAGALAGSQVRSLHLAMNQFGYATATTVLDLLSQARQLKQLSLGFSRMKSSEKKALQHQVPKGLTLFLERDRYPTTLTPNHDPAQNF